MPGGSGVRYTFLFGRIGITVGHWVQPDPEGDEHGSRLEIQRMYETQDRPLSEFKEITLREPIWRADLFTWDAGKPGNWDRAHHHIGGNGMKPLQREWDAALTADPLGWVERQLRDVARVLRAGGAEDLVGLVDQAEVDQALPDIINAVRRCMKEELAAAGSQ